MQETVKYYVNVETGELMDVHQFLHHLEKEHLEFKDKSKWELKYEEVQKVEVYEQK